VKAEIRASEARQQEAIQEVKAELMGVNNKLDQLLRSLLEEAKAWANRLWWEKECPAGGCG